jgi:hypothetical protein
VTQSPGSVPELDQLEADFKFFRSLALVIVIGPFEAIATHSDLLIFAAISGAILIMVGSQSKIVVDARFPDYRRDPGHSEWYPGDICVIILGIGILVIVAVACVLISSKGGWPAIAAYMVALTVAVMRFCQQRWQRNETTFEYAAVLVAKDSNNGDPGSTDMTPEATGKADSRMGKSTSGR